MTKDLAYWRSLIQKLTIEGRALIDGEMCSASDGRQFECLSPIDGRLLTDVTWAGASEVDRAVAAARRSFTAGVWAGKNPRQRKVILQRWADLLEQHFDELALLETLDAGKPIADTATVDLPSSVGCLRWFAEVIDKVGGEVAPADHHLVGLVTREPIGVVAAIVPWNYPLLMAVWKLAPSLAAGNSVILKPSEKSPLTAIRIAQLAIEAGLPAGVLNVLPGAGDVGKLLALHQDIDCVAFTGSGAVGRQLMQYAAQSNMKRVWLELGGKSANIVMDDCADLERAARTAASVIFSNMGEICSAGSRLLVHRGIKEKLLARIQEAAVKYIPGNPLDPTVAMGAIIDQIQLDRVLDYINVGVQEATLLMGGRRMHASTGGYYVEPTIFESSTGKTRIAREEIFGPVLTVLTFDTLDEAIELANDSDYGLGAAIWTSNLTIAHDAARRLRAGTVWVNCYEETNDMNFPFGGFKQSGNGRDNSIHALEKYTELKSTIIRLR
ncbi:aldehyde dehydrogenase [Paraburkholderia sp. GAS334]|uniref:aldehyde dehydrogenase n=1 Tax=Paraburkholderia sp. GAS334 TaxID=3035131 RepID=UPI003D19BA24